MSYSAIDLAKYVVSKCAKDNHPISNLQLQKILYYIQKDFLNRNDIAFPDAIEAWPFGPVVPNVYYHYCGYGAMPILSLREEYEIDLEDKKFVDPLIERKRKLDPWTMVAETHKTDGAWDKIYKDGRGNHQVIPIELIKAVGQYYGFMQRILTTERILQYSF